MCQVSQCVAVTGLLGMFVFQQTVDIVGQAQDLCRVVFVDTFLLPVFNRRDSETPDILVRICDIVDSSFKFVYVPFEIATVDHLNTCRFRYVSVLID